MNLFTIKIQKEKQLNDLNQYNNNNSSSRLDARVRRVSDELNKSSSITRLTNDAKSSLSEREKKQEKILLSPITTSVTKPQFDIFANSDSEAGMTHHFLVFLLSFLKFSIKKYKIYYPKFIKKLTLLFLLILNFTLFYHSISSY